MDKVIEVGGKSMGLRATALTPRLYRFKMGRDLVVDMNRLKKAYERAAAPLPADASEEERKDAQLDVTDLTIFENVAYVMARQYDSALPDTIEEWLDGLDEMFTIYSMMPTILELWQANSLTTSHSKKK